MQPTTKRKILEISFLCKSQTTISEIKMGIKKQCYMQKTISLSTKILFGVINESFLVLFIATGNKLITCVETVLSDKA